MTGSGLGLWFAGIAVLLGVQARAADQSALPSSPSVTISGIPYVSVEKLAAYYGFGRPVSTPTMVRLHSKWSKLEIEKESRRMSFDGTSIWLTHATRLHSGRCQVAYKDVEKLLDPLLRRGAAVSGHACRTVVLDPGHGGRDKGARGRRRVEEKRVVLDIAKRARDHMAGSGLRVHLTRDRDRDLSLSDRCMLAARWRADVFVSIHINSSTATSARGVETFVVTPAGCPSTYMRPGKRTYLEETPGNRHDRANTVLGYYLQRRLVSRTQGPDRGLKHARFFVLRNAPCPAALLECGFVSNKEEEEQMLRRAYRDGIARAIADAILDYMATVKRGGNPKSETRNPK